MKNYQIIGVIALAMGLLGLALSIISMMGGAQQCGHAQIAGRI